MNDYFPDWRPAYPWSVDPLGLPALAVVAALLVVFTIWTYLGHPQATRRRVTIILALRLGALIIALLTAVRPTVGVNENPKLPSVVLVGVDLSESMTVRDVPGDQTRIEAVRKTLEKCQPQFDELLEKHGVSVVMYRFGSADFNEVTARYDPQAAADGKQSAYGAYLHRTYERWQAERVRMHIVIGDGADNGEAFTPAAEAGAWGRRGTPLNTFLVGRQSSGPKARDIIVTNIECNPSPAYIKASVEVTARVNAYGYAGANVVARVYLNDKAIATDPFKLESEKGDDGKGNKLVIPINAPEVKGEYKVKVEVGVLDSNDKVVSLPGELSDKNNAAETYLTVTKEGIRILIVDQARWEETLLRDALRGVKRFDLYEVVRQPGLAPTAAEKKLLDLEGQSYDVVIIGNLGADAFAHPDVKDFLPKLAKMADKKATGVMFLGGEDAFKGMPNDLLPLTGTGKIIDKLDPMTSTPQATYPVVPAVAGLEKMFKLPPELGDAKKAWDELNFTTSRLRRPARLSGFNELTLTAAQQKLYTVYAWTTVGPDGSLKAGVDLKWEDVEKLPPNDKVYPLLVGSQRGDEDSGRWLVFGGFDTYLWRTLDVLAPEPEKRTGILMHERFWRQCVLWLAHQDEEEGRVFARPQKRLLRVGDEQTVRVGMKLPSGLVDPTADLTVRIIQLAPGQQEPKPEDETKAPTLPVVSDQLTEKEGRKVLFRPSAAGEYYVVVTGTGKDDKGKTVPLRGSAKFIAVPYVSDEMLRVSANREFMAQLATATGGEAMQIEELPSFLEQYLKKLEQKSPDDAGKKPRYYPDWHRNRSRGFLTIWLVLFVLLLGTEWGLRRLWGMV